MKQTFKKCSSAVLAIIMLLGILPADVFALAPSETAVITAYTQPEDISAQFGTEWDALGLPAVIFASLADESSQELPATWTSAPAYDGDTAGSYTLTAAFDPGYTLAAELDAPSLTVTVEEPEEDAAETAVITAYTPPENITVSVGTPWSELGLPAALSVTLEDSTSAELPVSWVSAPVYDGDTAGSYTLTASFGSGCTLAQGTAAPTVNVTVTEAMAAVRAAVPDYLAMTVTSPTADTVDTGKNIVLQFTVSTSSANVSAPALVISMPATLGFLEYSTGGNIADNLNGAPVLAEAAANNGVSTLTYNFRYVATQGGTMTVTFPVTVRAYGGLHTGDSFEIKAQLYDGATLIETEAVTKTANNVFQNDPAVFDIDSGSRYIYFDTLDSQEAESYSRGYLGFYFSTQEFRDGRKEDIYPFSDVKIVFALPQCLTPGMGTDEYNFVALTDGQTISSGNFACTYDEAYTNQDNKVIRALILTCPGKTLADIATPTSYQLSIELPALLYRFKWAAGSAAVSINGSNYAPLDTEGNPASGSFTFKNGASECRGFPEEEYGSKVYAPYIGAWVRLADISQQYGLSTQDVVGEALFPDSAKQFRVYVYNYSAYTMQNAELSYEFNKESEDDPPLEFYEMKVNSSGFDLGTVTAYYRTNLNSGERSQVMTALTDTLSFTAGEYLTALRITFEKLPSGIGGSYDLVTLKLRRLAGVTYTENKEYSIKTTLSKPTFSGYTGSTANIRALSAYSCTYTIKDCVPINFNVANQRETDKRVNDTISVRLNLGDGERLEEPEMYVVMPNDYHFTGFDQGDVGSGLTYTATPWDSDNTLYSIVYTNGGRPNGYDFDMYFTIGPGVNVRETATLPVAFFYTNKSERFPVAINVVNEAISEADKLKFSAATGDPHGHLYKYTGSDTVTVTFIDEGSFNTTSAVGTAGGSEGSSVQMRLIDSGYYKLYFSNQLADRTTMNNFSAEIVIPEVGRDTPVDDLNSQPNALSLAMTGAATGGGAFAEAVYAYSTDGGVSYASSVDSWEEVTNIRATAVSVVLESGNSGYISIPLRPLYDDDTYEGAAAYVGAKLEYTTVSNSDVTQYMRLVSVEARTSNLTGTVFFDDDLDGVKDTAEDDDPGGIVYLEKSNGGSWDQLASALSVEYTWELQGSIQDFSLGALMAGDYRLRYILPEGSLSKFDPANTRFNTAVDTDGIEGNEIAALIHIDSETAPAALGGWNLGLQRQRTLTLEEPTVSLAYGSTASKNFDITISPALQNGQSVSLELEDDTNFSAEMAGAGTVRVSYIGPEVTDILSTKLTVSVPSAPAFGGDSSPVTEEVTVTVLPNGCNCANYTTGFTLSESCGSSAEDVGDSYVAVIPYYSNDTNLYYKLELLLQGASYCTLHSGYPRAKIELTRGSGIAHFIYESADYTSATAQPYTGNAVLDWNDNHGINITGDGTIVIKASFINPHNPSNPEVTVTKTIRSVRQNGINFTLIPDSDLTFDGSAKPVTVTATNYNDSNAAFTDATVWSVAYYDLNSAAPTVPMTGVPTLAGRYRAAVSMVNTAADAKYVKRSGASVDYEITPNRSTLTVDPSGGVWGGKTTVQSFEDDWTDTKAIPIPTRTGYTFTGWTKSTPFSGAMSSLTAAATYTYGSVNGATDTLTANWTANSYDVHYDGSGSTGGSTANTSHVYDTESALRLNGFTRSYTVTYDYNGAAQTTPDKATAVYEFNGWNDEQNGSGTGYTNGQNVKNLTEADDATVNLYAQWTGSSVTLPTPTRNGYDFAGWYSDPACSDNKRIGDGGEDYTPTASLSVYAKWTHIHSVSCGCSTTAGTQLSFTALPSGFTGGALAPGNYFLENDMTLTSSLTVSGSVNLCLNGHTLRQTGTNSSVIYISSGTLNLCDCESGGSISGGRRSDSIGGAGVNIQSGASFHMYAGTLTDNICSAPGGAVAAHGSFIMDGGLISGNQSGDKSGGVYVPGGGSLVMNGGEISGNNSSRTSPGINLFNGGVYSGGSVTLSGSAVIRDNYIQGTLSGGKYIKGSGSESDLCLNGTTVKIGSGGLVNGAYIGVMTSATPTVDSPVGITGNSGADYSSYIHSNRRGCLIYNSGSGTAQVVLLRAIATDATLSSLSYSVNGGASSAVAGFAPSTNSYDVVLPCDTAAAGVITLTGLCSSGKARISANSGVTLSGGAGTATLTVTAESGAVNTYTLRFITQNAAPAFSDDTDTLSSAADNVAVFTLTAAPAAGTVFKVYDAASAGNVAGSASFTGTALTVTLGTAPAVDTDYYVSAALTGKAESMRTPISVNAHITYAVHYKANGGIGRMTDGEAVRWIAFTLPDCTFTAPAGRHFKEWAIGSDDGEKLDAGKEHTFAADTDVYAVWELTQYSVSYAAGQHGSISGSTSADHDTAYTDVLVPFTGYSCPSAITMTMGGAAFTDFSYTPSTGAISIAANKITGNIEITGACQPNTYTVHYNGNGATGGSTGSSSHTYDAAKELTGNGFTRAYTVTYNYNGATGGNTVAGSSATYLFSGWNALENNTGTAYADGESVTNLTQLGTVELYAQWTSASITLPTPSRGGYAFLGWYSDPACAETSRVGNGGAAFTPAADMTLYAKWMVITRTITLTPSVKDFGSKTLGYTDLPAAAAVTITNTGNTSISAYTVSGGTAAFKIVYTSAPIGLGASDSFTVQPVEGLPAGTYSATVTVTTAEGSSKTINVKFTVDPALVLNVGEDTGSEGQAESKQTYDYGSGQVIVTIPPYENSVEAQLPEEEDVIQALLSPEELGQVANGSTIEIRLDVKRIDEATPEADRQTIEEAVDAFSQEVPDLTLGTYLEVSLLKRINDGQWQSVADAGETIKIVIVIPEELRNTNTQFFILRSHEGGYTLLEDQDDDPDTITVLSQYFSTYAIAYRGTPSPVIWPWLLAAAAAAVGTAAVLRKKKKEREGEGASGR